MCNHFEISRSGYYKASHAEGKRKTTEALIVELVVQIRHRHWRVGGKKLYGWLKEEIKKIDGRLGRDKFFDLLGRNNLLVKRRKKYVYTTQSYHRFRVYKNLVKDKIFTKAHQGWASDITYIRTSKGFVYLFLITDLYSRKIVGWSLSDSLRIEGALEALQMAIKQCCVTKGLIHHSDRGIQYCSNEYVKLLRDAKIEISMTEENHCYENATAERVNGILKQEYGLEEEFATKKQAIQATRQAIWLYNMERPHWSLQLCTPHQVHTAA
ncbi:MAG: IS3 family transposase [Gloeobacteraceae cyanobacterium ES-bin-316]|nr:IS3 family transposase [Ferruginibacter sp.]